MPSIFSADWRNDVNAELRGIETHLGGKANKATTLAGYGIADAYTKTQTDSAIAAASTDISAQLASKLDTSAAASFLRADGSVVAAKLTINSRINGPANGLQLQNTGVDVNMYMIPGSGWGHFLHASGTDFFILADRNRNRTWDTGNYPLQLAGASNTGWLYGKQIFTFAGGTLAGKLVTQPFNANANQGDGSSTFEVRASDANGHAAISFHVPGAYGMKVHLRADGYFGWGGWSSSAWRFYHTPAGDLVTAGNVTAYSDPRLKTDVERIVGALDIVDKLDGVRFTWNNKSTLIGRAGARDIGVLADQVEAVLPEAVSRSIEDASNDNERWLVVAYDKLVPVLIEALKELAGRVRALEGRQ